MPAVFPDSALLVLAAKAVVIGFGATATLLMWSCLALSARWNDLEEQVRSAGAPPSATRR